MSVERVQGGLNGAELFEEASCEVAKRYWGGANDSRVNGLVFGTARFRTAGPGQELNGGVFESAVNQLCAALNEGRGYRNKYGGGHPQDDKLDVVVWREFSDRRPGKLIGFGQCKTGTHWGRELPRLNPATFCQRWFDTQPVAAPVKLCFLSDRVADLAYHGTEAGVLFDRCRFLDYAQSLPTELLERCARWTRAVLDAHGLAR